MQRKHMTYWGLGVAAATLAIVALPLTTVQADTTEDPGTAALPVIVDAAADPAKAVVVRLDFASRTETSVASVAVSIQRAHSHIGDPPLLRLTTADADGVPIEVMNAWSPLWVFTNDGQERLEIQDSGSGSFVVPFAANLASLTVEDIELGQTVADVDLEGPIQDFCAANPADPDCLEADLGVDSVSPTGPLFAVMGDAVDLPVASVVSNAGPDGPVDAEVTRSVVADPGLTVVPSAAETVDVPALAVGSPQSLEKTYAVTCTAPGVHSVSFTTTIEPKLASVVDANPTNDSLTEAFEVDCAVPVTINIQPGSTTNPVKLNSGVLPLAVLTTSAGEYGNPVAFDATTIDPLSVKFGSEAVLLGGGGGTESHRKGHPERSLELDERTRDADLDLVLHFGPRTGVLTPSDTEGCVFGRFDGPTGSTAFFGCDVVHVK